MSIVEINFNLAKKETVDNSEEVINLLKGIKKEIIKENDITTFVVFGGTLVISGILALSTELILKNQFSNWSDLYFGLVIIGLALIWGVPRYIRSRVKK